MGIAAPVISAEMNDWTALGGGNSGIVGNAAHGYGFHVAADELPPTDYSRRDDPNGPNGPYVNWDYACAGDFSHKNQENLRALHRNVLARLMRGELPMICEFIGKPWADRPVYYWYRKNGVATLQQYTGTGHDHWSHISWYRSRVDQRAYLWTPVSTPPPASGGGLSVTQVAQQVIGGAWGNGQDRKNRLAAAGYNYDAVQAEVNRLLAGGAPAPRLRMAWPSANMPAGHFFGLISDPSEKSHGGYYTWEKPYIQALQQRLISLGCVPGITNPASGWVDAKFEQQTKDAVKYWQINFRYALTTDFGNVWQDDWNHLMTY